MMSLQLSRMWIWRFFVYTGLAAMVIAQNQQPADPFDKLAEHYHYKCWNQTQSLDAFTKLRNDASEFYKYLQYTFQFIPERKKTFCDTERGQLEKRIVEIAKDLKPCLPSQEQYLGPFIEKSFKEFLHFLCHNNGENVDKFFSARATQCRNNLQSTNDNIMDECFSKIFKPLSGHLMKKEACDDLGTVKKCFSQILERKCPSYGEYKTLNEEFFRYVSEPCGAGCAFYLNTLLLTIAVGISYMFGH